MNAAQAGASNAPASDGVVGNVGIDKIKMAVVVERHVAFIAELVLLDAERRDARKINKTLATIYRNPIPGHAARISWRIRVGPEHQLPVFFVRSGENIPKTIHIYRRFVSF